MRMQAPLAFVKAVLLLLAWRVLGSEEAGLAPLEEDVTCLLQNFNVVHNRKGAVKVASDDESLSCKVNGLTPGVCALQALATINADGTINLNAAESETSNLDYLKPERLERALFLEIDAALAGTHEGETFSSVSLYNVMEKLKPLFESLPKNQYGRLGHAPTRYALHQHFLRRHGWYVRSLNPVGEAQTPQSPGEALRGRVPENLQSLIERRQHKHGVGLRELAVLVTTLEYLMDGDMGERLRSAYKAHDLSYDSDSQGVSRESAIKVLKTYMAHFLSLKHRSGYAMSPEQAQQEQKELETGLQAYVWRQVASDVLDAMRPMEATEFLSFSDVKEAAKVVDHHYEKFMNKDCKAIKRDFSALDGDGTGKVSLAELHEDALKGKNEFAESTEYLRTVGALDESDPATPRVLLANYINGPSNCLGTTSFFDVCCPDECAMLREKIEAKLGHPEVTAAQIFSAVESVGEHAALTPQMSMNLTDIAKENNGKVQIHGRDFSEWLHNSFPEKCPRPRAEEYDGAKGFGNEHVPDAGVEFQAVADVMDSVRASKEQLREELQSLTANEQV